MAKIIWISNIKSEDNFPTNNLPNNVIQINEPKSMSKMMTKVFIGMVKWNL